MRFGNFASALLVERSVPVLFAQLPEILQIFSRRVAVNGLTLFHPDGQFQIPVVARVVYERLLKVNGFHVCINLNVIGFRLS